MPNNTAEKLERRRSRHTRPTGGKIKASAFKAPGSRNRHKSAPKGAGKRPKTNVRADSRAATSN